MYVAFNQSVVNWPCHTTVATANLCSVDRPTLFSEHALSFVCKFKIVACVNHK